MIVAERKYVMSCSDDIAFVNNYSFLYSSRQCLYET